MESLRSPHVGHDKRSAGMTTTRAKTTALLKLYAGAALVIPYGC